MNTEHNTSLTLKYSVFVSVFIVIVGLILYMADMGDKVLWAGLLMVIVSPLLGVIVTTISLWMEKDLKWMYIALLLIAISVIGILLK
jgi:uncharacterized membrane protein